MNPVSPALPTANPVAPTSAPPRLMAAARQFEALLLETLLGPLERSFSTVPGGSSQPESDTYQSMGVQALASGLTASGGLGIASMIVRNILRNHEITPNPATKVSLTSRR